MLPELTKRKCTVQNANRGWNCNKVETLKLELVVRASY